MSCIFPNYKIKTGNPPTPASYGQLRLVAEQRMTLPNREQNVRKSSHANDFRVATRNQTITGFYFKGYTIYPFKIIYDLLHKCKQNVILFYEYSSSTRYRYNSLDWSHKEFRYINISSCMTSFVWLVSRLKSSYLDIKG